MSISNITVFMPSVFMLIGIPGLESVQCWIGIPFCAMYLTAVIGNALLLIIIKSEPSLHEPMYIFLGMLGVTDIALSTSIVPKMLGIFWFHIPEIYFDSCLLQMWLIHTFQGIESGILLAMALDRYVAICHPLRYTVIMNRRVCIQLVWGACSIGLIVAMTQVTSVFRLPFCATKVAHFFCDIWPVMKLSCIDTTVNEILTLIISVLVILVPMGLVFISYILIISTIL